MSASREKQNRRAGAGQADPKTARAAQQQKEEKRASLLYGAIAVVFLIVVVASAIWRSNLIPRMTTAVSIDGQNYSSAEVAYYYQSAYRSFVSTSQYGYYLSYLGLDTSISLKNQEISKDTAAMLGMELPGTDAEPAEDEALSEDEENTSTGMTWHDFFLDQAIENMTVIQAGLKAADAEGFQTPAGIQAQYDAEMAGLKSAAAASGVSVNQYLKSTYGSGVTEKIYGEQLMRAFRYGAYTNAYRDSLTYSDSELEEVYNADRGSFDHVTYDISSISGAALSTTDDDGNAVEPTEEESAAALEAAQEIAQALLDGINAGEDLGTLVDDYEEATYTENSEATYSDGSIVSEWLYDSARKSGDAAALEDGTTQYVVVFHDRFRDENPTIDVRHILVPLGTGTLTAEDEGYDDEQAQLKANAHAKAEELLAQWQSGEATEESFAALAMAESTDGSRYDGGLYTEVYQGQMVTEFNDWCFDASRKPGDTGVVDTQFGSHVMYFCGVNRLNRWQVQAANILRSEDTAAWQDSLVENVTVQRNESGLKRIG